MSNGLFNFKKALSVFGLTPEQLQDRGMTESELPDFARASIKASGKTPRSTASASAEPLGRSLKSWSLNEMPSVGQRIGFMEKPARPLAISIFVTKGGVLKSSLTLNLARMAALHGMRVCVVGLDMQCDISTALDQSDSDSEWDEASDGVDASHAESLERAIEKMDAARGLADLFAGTAKLDELILPTDIPTLFYIPETPELVALDQSLVNRNRREYWLREKVVEPLKCDFDLVLMDCSPNWNRLITNSLIACDVLISPLECKINNFRNFRAFCALMSEFKDDLQADFRHIFVPTRLASGRKLSQEIYQWYRTHLATCMSGAVRESIQGEEAMALKISIAEHAPTSVAGGEMHEILKEIWSSVLASTAIARSPVPVASRGSEFTRDERMNTVPTCRTDDSSHSGVNTCR